MLGLVLLELVPCGLSMVRSDFLPRSHYFHGINVGRQAGRPSGARNGDVL